MKKNKNNLIIPMLILRFTRGFLLFVLFIIFISSVIQIATNNFSKISKYNGNIIMPLYGTISFSMPSLSIPATIQYEGNELKTLLLRVTGDDRLKPCIAFDSSLRIINPTRMQKALSLIYNLIFLISCFWVSHMAIKIMQNYRKEDLFNPKNIYYLKIISLIIALAPLILWLIYIIHYFSITSLLGGITSSINYLSLTISFKINAEKLLFISIGGFLYVLAIVYERGLNIKEENDLTV